MIHFFTPVRLALLAALAATIVAGFIMVPADAMLPVHWNGAGEVDLVLPRLYGLLLPGIATAVIWGIFLAVDRIAKATDREGGVYVVGVVLTALTALMLTIALVTLLIGIGVPTNMVQVLAIALAILLLVLGNAMPKSQPNAYAGIRMPTTLRSEANWAKTHRLGGWLMMAGGAALLISAFAVPRDVLVWWVVACILGPVLIAASYSLVLARRGI